MFQFTIKVVQIFIDLLLIIKSGLYKFANLFFLKMNISEIKVEAINEQIIKIISDKQSGFARLNILLRKAGIEKRLLNISTYEKASFFPDTRKIKQLNQLRLDRLSLVYPPSFDFSLRFEISGHFIIKYKSADVNLPKSIDPFIIDYTGIVVIRDNGYEIKNESVQFVEN